MERNIILEKTYSFALEIITIYQDLNVKKKEYVLAKQILRSGTSIGANVNEAMAGESKKDFVHKLGVALKEARETDYWLRLLNDSNFIGKEVFNKAIADCREIIRILSSIILTTREKYNLNQNKTKNNS